jgi:hypothetical protein
VLAIRRERSRVIFFLEQFQEVSVDHWENGMRSKISLPIQEKRDQLQLPIS